MSHKICLGGFTLVENKDVIYLSLATTSLSALRLKLMEFERVSRENHVLAVDAKNYSERTDFFKKFSLFLKVLENELMKGEIWFFNCSLSEYPVTIRTRCETIPKPVKENTFSQDMVDGKEFFIDFLHNLDVLRQKNFFVLYTYIQKMKEIHRILFRLWLSKSNFFSKKELSICGFLRVEHFKKVYDSFFADIFYEHNEADLKVLFLFLICYKALRMQG